MTNQETIKSIMVSFSGQANIIVIPRIYIVICEYDHRMASFLNQCIYWSDRSTMGNGWFAKSQKEWFDELAIPRDAVMRITQQLKSKGWIQTQKKMFKGAPTTHYRPIMEKIIDAISTEINNRLSGNATNDCGETPQTIVGNPDALLYTENTSENTDKDYINDHPQLPNGDYQIEQVQLISEECMNETNYTKNTFSGLKPIGINGDSSQIQPTRRSGKYKAGNFSNLEKMILRLAVASRLEWKHADKLLMVTDYDTTKKEHVTINLNILYDECEEYRTFVEQVVKPKVLKMRHKESGRVGHDKFIDQLVRDTTRFSGLQRYLQGQEREELFMSVEDAFAE